jgi:hypothetical protein
VALDWGIVELERNFLPLTVNFFIEVTHISEFSCQVDAWCSQFHPIAEINVNWFCHRAKVNEILEKSFE